MGWTFCDSATKESLRREITAERGNLKTLRSQFRGNTLWCLHELRSDEGVVRFVGCYLLAKRKGQGWGYKDMDESVGPCYYDCPITYIDEATEPVNEYSAAWRERVRSFARTDAAQRAKRPQIGEEWSLIGCKIPSVRIHSVRPLHGYYGSTLYRVKRRHLGLRVSEQSTADAETGEV